MLCEMLHWFYRFFSLSLPFLGHFPGIWKCSVRELSDVAIWKAHLARRTLPDSGPNAVANGHLVTLASHALAPSQIGEDLKSSQQCTSSAWKVTKVSIETSKARSAGRTNISTTEKKKDLRKLSGPLIKQDVQSLEWGITAFTLFSTYAST